MRHRQLADIPPTGRRPAPGGAVPRVDSASAGTWPPCGGAVPRWGLGAGRALLCGGFLCRPVAVSRPAASPSAVRPSACFAAAALGPAASRRVSPRGPPVPCLDGCSLFRRFASGVSRSPRLLVCCRWSVAMRRVFPARPPVSRRLFPGPSLRVGCLRSPVRCLPFRPYPAVPLRSIGRVGGRGSAAERRDRRGPRGLSGQGEHPEGRRGQPADGGNRRAAMVPRWFTRRRRNPGQGCRQARPARSDPRQGPCQRQADGPRARPSPRPRRNPTRGPGGTPDKAGHRRGPGGTPREAPAGPRPGCRHRQVDVEA